MSTLLAIVVMASALVQLLMVIFMHRAWRALQHARQALLRARPEQGEEHR